MKELKTGATARNKDLELFDSSLFQISMDDIVILVRGVLKAVKRRRFERG